MRWYHYGFICSLFHWLFDFHIFIFIFFKHGKNFVVLALTSPWFVQQHPAKSSSSSHCLGPFYIFLPQAAFAVTKSPHSENHAYENDWMYGWWGSEVFSPWVVINFRLFNSKILPPTSTFQSVNIMWKLDRIKNVKNLIILYCTYIPIIVKYLWTHIREHICCALLPPFAVSPTTH